MKRELHDGKQDGLEPLEPLDLTRVHDFSDLLQSMSKTAFGGRCLGEALDVLIKMNRDKSCTKILTLSGAMTIAKMGKVLCDMIEASMVDIIISTGAIMAHGISENIGGVHYKYDPRMSDKVLWGWGYNRVYDTIEKEENLNDTERMVCEVFEKLKKDRPTCSSELTRMIGKNLADQGMMPSILGCAYQHNVPVYIPAFTDSELGLDFSIYRISQKFSQGKNADLEAIFSDPPAFNPFYDLYDYATRAVRAEKLGIFTIGGGVPRNWAQQVAPYVDIINERMGFDLHVPRFQYGIRICPEPVHWGGLSGCTYSEGVSWGKFVDPAEGGCYAEVYCDATIAWPILVKAFLEQKKKKKKS